MPNSIITIGGAAPTADQLAALRGLSSQSVNTLSARVHAAIAAMPVPKNNLLCCVGDSRTATTTTQGYALADVLWPRGFAAWMQIASEFRFEMTGNYGVAGDTLAYIRNRLNGNATASTAGVRDNFYTVEPGKSCGTVVFFSGVNDQQSSESVTGPIYLDILQKMVDNGINVVLVTEIPQNNAFGSGVANLLRHQYMENIVLTGPNANRLIKVNVWDKFLVPGTIYGTNSAPGGYYGDDVHPNAYGSKVFGEAVGEVLKQMAIAHGFPARSTSITKNDQGLFGSGMMTGSGTISATNGEAAGAGGANMDGAGGVGVSGSIVGAFGISRSSALRNLLNQANPVADNQLKVVCSIVLDSDGFYMQRFRITGQLGATGESNAYYDLTMENASYITQAAYDSGMKDRLTDGDALYLGARVRIGANPKGLSAAGIAAQVATQADSSGTGINTQVFRASLCQASSDFDLKRANLEYMAGKEFDLLTPQYIVPTGFKTGSQKNFWRRFVITVLNKTPIDITVDVGRLDFRRNL